MGIKIEAVHNKSTIDKEKVSILNREFISFGSSFSNKSKEDFYSELSVLLQSGINLKTGLELIQETQKKQKDKDQITAISESIVSGNSLYEALQDNKAFTSYEYQAIKIGEQTGKLATIVEELHLFFHRKNELRRQLISSLSYPIIVLILAVIIVFFMLRYVVPMFVDIFKQNNVELPWITQQIVNISTFLTDNGSILAIVVLGLFIGYKWFSKTEVFYKLIGVTQLKIPVLGTYLKKIYLIQFTQAMSLLTAAKVPVVTGIGLVKDMIRFYPLEKTLSVIEKDLVQGTKLHTSFSKHDLYDKKMVALLRVAEETNQTEFIFQKLCTQYSNEIKYKGQIITNIFNFILTLSVGVIVGVILVAMYLPMFKLSSILG